MRGTRIGRSETLTKIPKVRKAYCRRFGPCVQCHKRATLPRSKTGYPLYPLGTRWVEAKKVAPRHWAPGRRELVMQPATVGTVADSCFGERDRR